ncbi:MAG: hypothetical protein ABIO24_03195, partial [Saprospiraceae bacterium]
MSNSKFFSLLGALDSTEFHAFNKHLRQRHHRDATVLQVFDYLKNLYPDFEQPEKLALDYIYRRIFKRKGPELDNPGKKVSDALSDLNLCLKDFLIARHVLQDDLAREMIWLQVLRSHELTADFTREATRFYNQTIQKPLSKISDCLETWLACYFQREHLGWNKKNIDRNAIQECTEVMTLTSEIIHLKMACEVGFLNQTKSRGLLSEADQADQVAQRTESNPLRTIYYELLQLVTTNRDNHFDNIETVLKTGDHHISSEELNELLLLLHNQYAPLFRNGGEVEASSIIHRLHLIGLQFGMFTQAGILSALEFPNIVSIACTAGDIDWAEQFISEYSRFLSKDSRQDTELLSLAMIDFSRKQFRKVLQKLEGQPFSHFHNELRAKCLILRAYYELPDQQDNIYDFCDAFFEKLRKKPPSD